MADKARSELRANLMASMATGGTIMCFTNPLDTMRCRWQVSGGSGQTLVGFIGSVARQEGIWKGFWRPGLPPNVVAMAMAIGGRNGFYPLFRDGISGLAGGNEKAGPRGMFAAGLLAGCTGYFFATPLLQVKTQMQVEAGKLSTEGLYLTGARTGLAPTYSGALNALSTLARDGGSNGGVLGSIKSLWRGAGVIIGRGAALSASQLAAYDSTKTYLKTKGYTDGPVLHFAASQAGAVCCTTFSMPLDVVLTVYTSAQTLGGERKALYGQGGPVSCALAMARHDGPLVFFRGWVPAFMRLSPTVTLSFFVYEQLRRLVGIGYLD